ncbi:MAG: (2Fe-2S)-binding protein [Myxococcales bacterium]|nr:(2Fe-2S)-binding protein [Myxococcales bacterium]
MIICHCMRLSDRDIRAAVRAGATTREQVERACGASGGCGGCGPAVDEILAEEGHGQQVVFLPLQKSA